MKCSKASFLSGSVVQFRLERRPVTAEVTGSSPVGVAKYCPLAQSVEHAAVNRAVVGSSPTWAAIHRESDETCLGYRELKVCKKRVCFHKTPENVNP